MTWKRSGVARWRYNPRQVQGGRQVDRPSFSPTPSSISFKASSQSHAPGLGHLSLPGSHPSCLLCIVHLTIICLLLSVFLLVLFLLYFDYFDLLLSFHLPFFLLCPSLYRLSLIVFIPGSLFVLTIILIYYCHFIFFYCFPSLLSCLSIVSRWCLVCLSSIFHSSLSSLLVLLLYIDYFINCQLVFHFFPLTVLSLSSTFHFSSSSLLLVLL